MKRLLLVTAAVVASGAGWMTLAPAYVAAQAPAAQPAPTPGRGLGPPAVTNLFTVTGTPETKMTPGKAMMWTREQQANAKSHIEWSPQYRLTATTRQPATAPPAIGELHTENTQIYLITGGRAPCSSRARWIPRTTTWWRPVNTGAGRSSEDAS